MALLTADIPFGNGGPAGTSGTVTGVTAGDASITIGGTANAPTVALSTTQPNANTWTLAQIFNGSTTHNAVVNIPFASAGGCATGSVTAELCIGSPSATDAMVIGKITGAFGGTTSSNSANNCYTSNNGTTDATMCQNFTSAKVYQMNNGGIATSILSNNTPFSTGTAQATFGRLQQNASGNWAGTCAMAAATTCTMTLTVGYTTPLCISEDVTAFVTSHCTASGTTVTVTASGSNSDTFNIIVVGNPG